MASGAFVTLNFGAWMPPTPTPSSTPIPALDPTGAEQVFCGGVYSGDTTQSKNNVSSYSCVPWWDESGNEKVYRLELSSTQPVTVTLLNASVDLDLFLLRYVSPASCVAAGDNYLKYDTMAGVYFLSVDGYKGANGSYSFRVDCPVDAPATPTPTFTPSVTPSPTATLPATVTPSPTSPAARIYLPTVLRNAPQGPTGPTVTLVLQDGLYGYSGTSDTTLDSWQPAQPSGADNRLRLFYSRPPSIVTQKSPVVKFDLSLLPPGAAVSSATLRLWAPAAPAHDVRAQAHGVLRAWDEATASWNEALAGQPWTQPGASAVGVDRTLWASSPQQILEGARWYEFDITPLAQQWAQEPNSNHGVVLTALAGDSGANVEARFASRESGLISRPQLVISFVLPVSAP
jgi:hypothetical protein